MKNGRYEQVIFGEWFPLKKKNQLMQCCDCGLTHREEYQIRDGDIYMRCWPAGNATRGARKRYGIKIARKKK